MLLLYLTHWVGNIFQTAYMNGEDFSSTTSCIRHGNKIFIVRLVENVILTKFSEEFKYKYKQT